MIALLLLFIALALVIGGPAALGVFLWIGGLILGFYILWQICAAVKRGLLAFFRVLDRLCDKFFQLVCGS